MPPPVTRLAEQAQQGRARVVGDRQRLHTQLLLGLQGGQSGGFLGEIRVDQVAGPRFQGVLELLGEGQLTLIRLGVGTDRLELGSPAVDSRLDRSRRCRRVGDSRARALTPSKTAAGQPHS
jgi:hypothetical protein